MSLVAYGNSTDGESDEYDSNEEHNKIEKNGNIEVTPSEAKPTLTLKLPIPKTEIRNSFIEEDDEFLHKKAIGPSEQPPQPVKRSKVKIVIPALQKKEENENSNKKVIGAQPNKPTGLLNLLPKPAAFGGFKKTILTAGVDTTSSAVNIRNKGSTGLIPHSVAKNTANANKAVKKIPTNDESNSGSDSSDNDDDDFFSFHTENKLPEVSQNEINAMIAKKTAQMKTATITYLKNMDNDTKDEESDLTDDISEQPKIDEEALQALCGSGAKRARRGESHDVVIELSGDQVLPNRDEWLRNQLQSTTEYQPRGMVDEEPAAGTRKKHQITYLAHQAKANEQELQAMWAANRHTRRQTQNKYGF